MTTIPTKISPEQLDRLRELAPECISINLSRLAYLAKRQDREMPEGESVFYDLSQKAIFDWLEAAEAEWVDSDGYLKSKEGKDVVEKLANWQTKILRTIYFWKALK